MLATRGTQPSLTFTRQDLRRSFVGAAILIVALTAIFALDLIPRRLDIKVGDVATADIVAPRADSYVSRIRTDAARTEASRAVEPVYDFSDERAAAIATAQTRAFERLVGPIDTAFEPDVKEENRQRLLDSVSGLSDDARATLNGLESDRWKAVHDEAERVLDLTERNPLRDDKVQSVRAAVTQQMVGLNVAERTLAAELISPLIGANSSYSDEQTNLARQRAADQVPDVVIPYAQNETIVRRGEKVTPEALEALEYFGLLDARPDVFRLGGWFLIAVLVVGTLLGWVWRFRRQLWHRTNALILIGLIVFGTTLILKITAGRPGLPFIIPTAAAGMLLAILLDSGVATVVLAMLALLGGAVNGNSIEPMAYIFFGGLAGIVAIRRGDRFQVFLQAGLVVAIVNVLVVAAYGFLGSHDGRGVIELIGASLLSAAGSAIVAVGSFAVLGSVFGILTVFQLL
ncbi:MAG: hypothetical protein ACJ761_01135, partial [Chloroflexota bacterium]